MPKKAEITTLAGNIPENSLVQKTIPLLLMRKDPFTLGELKVLDAYLGRINSHDIKNRRVVFTKAEYEKLMGISEVRIDQLKKYTDGVQTKVAEVRYSDKMFDRITLFSATEFEQNEYGEWVITLVCSEEAKKYIFNPEKVGYIKYLLKYSLALNSKHSFRLYGYLLKNRFRHTWSESLDVLKYDVFKLDSQTTSSYDVFKEFKRTVLDKALADVNKNTDIEFKISTEKRGKTVVAIKFELVKEPTEYPDQIAMDEYLNLGDAPDEDEDEEDEKLTFLAEACDDEFSQEQINELLQNIVLKNLPEHEHGELFAQYYYLKQKYAVLKHYASIKKIPNRFRYIKKIIEND